MTLAAPSDLLPSVRSFISGAKRLLINGEWVPAASGQTFATHDPATGQEICQVAHGGPEDVQRAVAAARIAFDDGAWARVSPHQKAQILWRVGDVLDARAAEFG